ncbi:MAG TPA: PD-(D/E)XK nuclease family protein [Thermoplasmata archaeon]|jgi:CRISPR-associated exonuclease Cas4|nr:PD-(D/E)XK nuclease family protein [Thermoplasmata archaeon]
MVGLPPLSVPTVAAGVVVAVGLALAAWALRALGERRRDAARGRLVAVDAGRAMTLRSERYRLAGRPDELRQLADGRLVPVEFKSRPTPARGPTPSHVAQVRAYCLLVQESTGVAPPYGVLRYADGEFRVRWDERARAELLAVRVELLAPYDGRATPSPARCARCPWVRGCDARVTGGGPSRPRSPSVVGGPAGPA